MEKLIIKSEREDITLRKELYWVYSNILNEFGEWDKKKIKKRMEEIRFK